jgi:hypothetical protein
VLKPGGRAVHVLPSASWRLWTILTHYLDLPARVVARFRPAASPPPQPSPIKGEGENKDTTSVPSPPSATTPSASRGVGEGQGGGAAATKRSAILNALFEFRHGERGTTLGELYLFSRPAWRALFRRNGFVVETVAPLGLFYTGYSLFDRRLGIAARRGLARVLGSATVLYVLRDAGDAT